MFTTRENTILWVRAQQQVNVKEKMCFILRALHGLTQKLLVCCGSTLWYLMHLALLCCAIVAEDALSHRYFTEKEWSCCTAKTSLLRRQKRNSKEIVRKVPFLLAPSGSLQVKINANWEQQHWRAEQWRCCRRAVDMSSDLWPIIVSSQILFPSSAHMGLLCLWTAVFICSVCLFLR